MPKQPKSSRDLDGPKPRRDERRETDEAIIEDADETEGRERDRVHGDGGEIGLDPAQDQK